MSLAGNALAVRHDALGRERDAQNLVAAGLERRVFDSARSDTFIFLMIESEPMMWSASAGAISGNSAIPSRMCGR